MRTATIEIAQFDRNKIVEPVTGIDDEAEIAAAIVILTVRVVGLADTRSGESQAPSGVPATHSTQLNLYLLGIHNPAGQWASQYDKPILK